MALVKQSQPTSPREDRDLPVEIQAGADVTGTVVFVARRDEAVTVEFFRTFGQDNPDGSWDLGPVIKLPERQFADTR